MSPVVAGIVDPVECGLADVAFLPNKPCVGDCGAAESLEVSVLGA